MLAHLVRACREALDPFRGALAAAAAPAPAAGGNCREVQPAAGTLKTASHAQLVP